MSGSDDDIQIIEPSVISSPSTVDTLPTPPTSSKHPQPSSFPAPQPQMAPANLQVAQMPPMSTFQHYLMEMGRKSAILQQMLVQGAENLDTINEMMILKEEVVQYVYLMCKEQGDVPTTFPYFYGFSLFWIVMKSQSRGRRTVYAQHLGNVIKQRISEELGRQVPDLGPAWASIQETLMKFGHCSRNKNPKLRQEAGGFLERLIGETYQYIDRHYSNYGIFPRAEFFYHFCSFYNSLRLEVWGRDYFKREVISRLRRRLPTIPTHCFDHMENQIDVKLGAPTF